MYEKMEYVLTEESTNGRSFSRNVIEGRKSDIHRFPEYVLVIQRPNQTQENIPQSIWLIYRKDGKVFVELVFEAPNTNTTLKLGDTSKIGSRVEIEYFITSLRRSYRRKKRIDISRT